MLNVSKINSLKPTGKPYKVADSNRFYVYVSAKGTKTFRLDYTIANKHQTLTIGQFPELTLAEARTKAEEARKQIKRGVNPSLSGGKKHNFKLIAEEYRQLKDWDERHKQTRRLELYVYPYISGANINNLEAPDILALLKPIEKKGTGETAHRVLNLVGQIFRFAIQSGHCKYDITQNLRGALKAVQKGHFKAITDINQLRQAYLALSLIPSPITRGAIKMAILTAARPGEIRKMKWQEIDLKKQEWSFTAQKTKTQHITPLSKQAMEILKEMKLYNSTSEYVFTSLRGGDKGRALSDTAMLMALQRAGIESTSHGFRASFRTIGDEVLNYPPHLLEQQLAHEVKDSNGRSYNRTAHISQRKEILQAYADLIQPL